MNLAGRAPAWRPSVLAAGELCTARAGDVDHAAAVVPEDVGRQQFHRHTGAGAHNMQTLPGSRRGARTPVSGHNQQVHHLQGLRVKAEAHPGG
jgi:hypothetical protein